jgi:hypothetical protein
MDSNPYLNGAIGILSDLTAYLYNDKALWAVRVMDIKSKVLAAVNKVDAKVDEVKTEVVGIKTEVVEIKTEVAEIKTEMKLMDERLLTQINDVRASLCNGMAIQLNSL